jgi:uncharacterized protein YlxW (UPF0749 family)
MSPLQNSASITGLIIANAASIGFLVIKELVKSSFWNARERKAKEDKQKQEERERLDSISKQVAALATSVSDLTGTVALVKAQTDMAYQAFLRALSPKTDP